MDNREEQIYEMASVISENSPLTRMSSEDLAEVLYNENYRKQIEGKWLVADTLRKDEDGITWSRYSCSKCGCTTEAYYSDPGDISRFCPNCGAKMNGGNN